MSLESVVWTIPRHWYNVYMKKSQKNMLKKNLIQKQ